MQTSIYPCTSSNRKLCERSKLSSRSENVSSPSPSPSPSLSSLLSSPSSSVSRLRNTFGLARHLAQRSSFLKVLCSYN